MGWSFFPIFLMIKMPFLQNGLQAHSNSTLTQLLGVCRNQQLGCAHPVVATHFILQKLNSRVSQTVYSKGDPHAIPRAISWNTINAKLGMQWDFSLSWQSFRLGRLLKLIPFFSFSSLGKKRHAKSDTGSASLKSFVCAVMSTASRPHVACIRQDPTI